MPNVLLLQLPVPHQNFACQTGNIPLGAACLKQVASDAGMDQVEILPELTASYLGDKALVDLIASKSPDIVGFTTYSWNLERSLHIADQLKSRLTVKIILGGPEITPDNECIQPGSVDFLVYGEGEVLFQDLLKTNGLWQSKSDSKPATAIFESSPSPYLSGIIQPGTGRVMLLETQRGCPYRCGFCYYNKSSGRLTAIPDERVYQAIRWASDHDIGEVYLLDPSLNTRPHLKQLLKGIGRINFDRKLRLSSEIRAEAVDGELARLFSQAGFSEFEIGLQSTNPKALDQMNRPTDLNRFLRGVNYLRDFGIQLRIDLIVGLPGDDLEGFKRSVDFVAAHDLHDSIQVFPLSVLPGTEFRKRSEELGLRYHRKPNYTVIETAAFKTCDILAAFDYAEEIFDTALHPGPDLDLSYHGGTKTDDASGPGFSAVTVGSYIHKLIIHNTVSSSELVATSGRLTFPYQLLFKPEACHPDNIARTLEILTSANPYSPLEIVFMDPSNVPDTSMLQKSIRLHRPHYLDNELRFQYEIPGNRAVIFTLLTTGRKRCFNGDMHRQILWWRQPYLPDHALLQNMDDLDGILIETQMLQDRIHDWQDQIAPHADVLTRISFADIMFQRRWNQRISTDYCDFETLDHHLKIL